MVAQGVSDARDPLIRVGVVWTVAAVGLLLWLLATGLEAVGAAILLAPIIGALVAHVWPRS